MSKHQVIPYETIEEIIFGLNHDKRTQALVTFQYTSGARVGELLKYNHTHRVTVYNKEKGRKVWTGKTKHNETYGLRKNNFNIQPHKISWSMPNFKAKSKPSKNPFVLRKEMSGVMYLVIKNWLAYCGEQVFQIGEKTARNSIKKAVFPLSSHSLRKSRGTHLVEIFGFNPYDILNYLGHTRISSGLFYVEAVNQEKKMQEVLEQKKEV